MIHCGVRWNRSRWDTRSTSALVICTAEEPVPITPTRRPSTGTSWSHRAQWNAAPAKETRTARSGTLGWWYKPVVVLTKDSETAEYGKIGQVLEEFVRRCIIIIK